MRVEAGDGEVREPGPGGTGKLDDVAGAGDTTTGLGDEPVQLAMVPL